MGNQRQDQTEATMNKIFKEEGIPLTLVGDRLVPSDPKDSDRSKFDLPDHDSFKAAVMGAAASCRVVSVLFLDLDNFKKVNDTYDHRVGDGVIREMAATVSEVIQGKGELYHRSGDEILVAKALRY
jgi:GGDEF domain-containing protein